MSSLSKPKLVLLAFLIIIASGPLLKPERQQHFHNGNWSFLSRTCQNKQPSSSSIPAWRGRRNKRWLNSNTARSKCCSGNKSGQLHVQEIAEDPTWNVLRFLCKDLLRGERICLRSPLGDICLPCTVWVASRPAVGHPRLRLSC